MLVPFLAMALLHTAVSTGIRSSVKKYTQPPNILSLDKHETTYIWDISDKYTCNTAMTFKDTVLCCLNSTVQEIQNTHCEESVKLKLLQASQQRVNLQNTQQTYTRFKTREIEKQLEIKKEFNKRNEKATRAYNQIMSIASDNWDREKIECLQLFQSSITRVQYNQQVLQTLKLNIVELSKCKKFAGLLKEDQKSQTYRKTIPQSWTNKSFDERVKAMSETETSTMTKLLKEESDADKAEADALASVEREARNAAAGAATVVNAPSKVVEAPSERVNASHKVVQTDTQVVKANKKPAATVANSEIRPPSNVVHTPSNVVHTDSKVVHGQQAGGGKTPTTPPTPTTPTKPTTATAPTTPTTATAPTAPTTTATTAPTAPPIPPILFVLSLALIVLCSQCKFKCPKEFLVPGVTLVCIVLLQVLILHGISTFVLKRSPTKSVVSFLELDAAQQITETKEHKQPTLATCKFVQNQVASLIDLPAVTNNPIETKSVSEESYAIHHQFNNFVFQCQQEELTASLRHNECKLKVDNVFVQAQALAQEALDKQTNVAFDRMEMRKGELDKVETNVAQLAKSAETNALEMFTTKKDSVTELLNGMKREKKMQQEELLCTRRKALQEEKDKVELILEKMNSNGKLILPKYT